MAIKETSMMLKPTIGDAIALSVSYVDPITVTATFHYVELVQVDGVWRTEQRQQPLEMTVHYAVDGPRGLITLLGHDLWHSLGRWRAADREEELLYKGQVKRPQYVAVRFSYYAPASVTIVTDKRHIAGDGADAVLITACTEEAEAVDVVAFRQTPTGQDNVKTWTVPIVNGKGNVTARSNWRGRYVLMPDPQALDPQGRPLYATPLQVEHPVLEVV